ncbi:hypothetical protein WA026_000639 [Henosepilachna vigintioctopunctata]|uniref:Uncharacterized protein n=1 Tax=Henosepilachna vigintioctopunctata TaxID=420089 RepID=A0AAW1V4T3_9CUCU
MLDTHFVISLFDFSVIRKNFRPEKLAADGKLAHQFWISYPPPAAGSSASSKDKEKDKEEAEKRGSKDRERQLDYDAAVKEHQRSSQREQWQIRQLDNDLLQQRQSERDREREQKELAEQRLVLADDHEYSPFSSSM